jgi:GNAT superfamily N-acetyltransferase
MTDVHIDLATDGDAEIVGLLVCELFAELAAPDPSGYDPVAVTRTARDLLAGAPGAFALIARLGRDPVGLLTLAECAAIYAGGRFGEICELFVRPNLRSSGIGERLLERAVRIARERRWTRLEVGAPSLPRWQRSVDFYQHFGFVVVGPRLKLELR